MPLAPLDMNVMAIAPVAIARLATLDPHAFEDERSAEDVKFEFFSAMEPLEREWRRLESDNLNSLHQGYDWCLAWAKTHGNPLAIMRGTVDGECVCILPLEIVRQNMVRIAQFIGARFNNINTGLFAPAFRARCTKAVSEALAEALAAGLKGKADLVSLKNIPLDWRGDRNPFFGLPVIEHQNHSFQLPLFSDFDATIDQLNGKRRRKRFRGQTRKLEAAGGCDYVVARSDAEKLEMIDVFFHQKAVRFKALGIPNVFQHAETQCFFRMLLERSGDGQDAPLELHALRLKGENDGQIAAIAGMSRKGDHVICQFGSINEDLVTEASPGEYLFWLMIERYCAEGAALFDFGVGDQEYKRRWCTVETIQHDVYLPISAVGRLSSLTQKGLTRGKAVIKGNPQLYAMIQRLRAYADEEPEAPRQTG